MDEGYGWTSVLCKVSSTANVTCGERSHIWDMKGFGGRRGLSDPPWAHQLRVNLYKQMFLSPGAPGL